MFEQLDFQHAYVWNTNIAKCYCLFIVVIAPSSEPLKNNPLVQDVNFCGFSNPDDWLADINGNYTNSEIYDHRPQMMLRGSVQKRSMLPL